MFLTIPENGIVVANTVAQDIRFDFTSSVELVNATAVITLEGVIADSTDDIYTDFGNGWQTLTPAQLSDGGSTITIEGINYPTGYAIGVDLQNNIVGNAGEYTFSVVVDADGSGDEYEPSEPATVTLTVVE